jgi:preprotein translocase subunit SecA
MGYFRKYGNKIYGLTGTLGDKNSQKLLEDIYNIDIGFIPTYKKRQFEELTPIVTNNDAELLKNIIKSTINQASKNKAVLILCETISDAEKIENEIKKTYT